MAKVLTFSRTFPAYHPKKGQPTYFVEKFLQEINLIGVDAFQYFEGLNRNIPDKIIDDFVRSLLFGWEISKGHTIISGNRFKVGDYFSPRVWSGKPYNSKQIIIAPDIEVKKVWDIEITKMKVDKGVDGITIITKIFINGMHKTENYYKLAQNDGLSFEDLMDWFPKPFKGQIICWNENIEY